VIGIRDLDIGIRDSGFGVREVEPPAIPSPDFLEVHDAGQEVLVLCLGNDILRDDGVGWAIADQLEAVLRESRIPSPESRPFAVKRSALSGFYLLDELTGWDRVLVVDAVRTGRHPPGTVLSFPFEALGTDEGPSPHAAGLPTVIRLGRKSGVPLPSWIHIVAIEADDMESFVEGLTPAVEAAVPEAVAVIRSVLANAPAPSSVPA
jgi:hydrogenase maturation protease